MIPTFQFTRAFRNRNSLRTFNHFRQNLKRTTRTGVGLLSFTKLGNKFFTMAEHTAGEGAAQIVKEGKAEIFLPPNVFYNPVQEYNRDLTIAALSVFALEHLNTALNQANKVGKCKNLGNKNVNNFDGEQKTDSSIGGKEDTAFEDTINAKPSEDQDTINVTVSPISELSHNVAPGTKYPHGIRVFEALAASGLRSIRFALEVPGVREIVANDFDINALEFIQKNIKHNNVEDLVTANHDDASMMMYKNKKYDSRFDVIDLDPYGSPVGFLDSAVQAVNDGGLLIVTCTDMAILCGNASEKCYASYGAVSLRTKCCHEMAIRIALQSIEAHANKYGRYIVPLLSVSADFYIRVFVKVYTGQAQVKNTASKLAYVYYCTGCGTHTLQPVGHKIPTKGNNFKYTPARGPVVEAKCKHCGHPHHVGGPIWAYPVHDTAFIRKVIARVQQKPLALNTSSRIIGMLSLVAEELPDQPLYYITDAMCNVVHCTAPTLLQIRSAVMNAGYKVSMSHAAKNSLKTDAPAEVLWDILRCWVELNPVNTKWLKDGTPAKAILSQEPEMTADFTVREDANPKSRQEGLLRYQTNPSRNWGPKMKASRSSKEGAQEEKRERLQNKRKKSAKEQDLKQFPCKRFKQGQCDLGDECCYSHQLKEQATEPT